MDSENMKRVGLYLDKDLVNRADDMVKQFHFKSRNEFLRRQLNIISPTICSDPTSLPSATSSESPSQNTLRTTPKQSQKACSVTRFSLR